MAIPEEPTGSHHDSLDAVIAEYVQQVEAGAVPDREALLAQHPELADGLREFVADFDRLDCQAAELRLSGDSTEQPGELPRVRYFGEYELLEVIARGGMGVVYKARQASLNRVVALKMILRGQLATPRDVARFRAEAEAAANLDHPHIVPIYEVGEHEGQQYFTMRFVEGASLARQPRGDLRAEVGLVATVARAVHYAHQHGILHRDIKPSNILLAGLVPFITDFGLAKRLNSSSDLTRSGETPGTPRYMAPEQAAGRKDLTVAADVYSLGVVLYERLTGTTPFTGDDVLELLRQHREDAPPRPSARCPGLDRDLETICLKCLEKEPAKRYASAEALAEDLERWLRGEPILARPVSTRERVVRWVRRNPLVAGLTASVAVTLMTGTAVSTYFAVKTNASAQEAQKERDNARERLWKSLFEQARAERAIGARWRALELLGEAARMKKAPELRQEAIQAATSSGLRLVCKLVPRNVSITGDEPSVKFSFDGSMIAAPGGSFDAIQVWQVPSGQLLGQTKGYYQFQGFAFSPTAPLMALRTGKRVRLWEPKTGKEIFSFPGGAPVQFSPDGSLVVAAGENGVVLWDVRQQQERALPARGVPIAFVSDEELLVDDRNHVRLWNVRTQQETFTSSDGWTLIASDVGAIARDGPLIALRRGSAMTGVGTVAVWNVRSGRKVAELKVNMNRLPDSLPLSADAGLIAFQDSSDAQAIQLVDLASGKPRRRLVTPSQFGRALVFGRFNPNGTILAAQEERKTVKGWDYSDIRLWNVETGRLLATIYDHQNPIWSPDGRYLAALGPKPGDDLVYEVTPGTPTYRVPTTVQALTFSPDGRRLAAQGNAWEISEHHGRHLNPASVAQAPGQNFFASGGRIWSAQSWPEIKPSEPVKLQEVFPENRKIILAGVERKESGRVRNLAVSPDGNFLLLDWERRVPEGKDPGTFHTAGQLEFWDLTLPKRLGIW